MKICTLMENTACREGLAAEHGLSLYIEAAGKRILFDAGQSGAFGDNAKKMGIDLSAVDAAILSHGHYDHSGGLERFLAINPTAPIYLTPEALSPHYHGERYIGISPALAASPRLRPVTENTRPFPGIQLRRDLTLRRPIDDGGLSFLEKGAKKAEDFRHELYLLVEENGLRVLFSGCSHRGIENIAAHFRPDVLIGGFHFSKIPPDSHLLADTARALAELPCQYYTCHCTGLAQYAAMKEILGDRLGYLAAGSALVL